MMSTYQTEISKMPIVQSLLLISVRYINVVIYRYEKEHAIQGYTIPKHIKMYNFDKILLLG